MNYIWFWLAKGLVDLGIAVVVLLIVLLLYGWASDWGRRL
jgi:hypothetical protein